LHASAAPRSVNGSAAIKSAQVAATDENLPVVLDCIAQQFRLSAGTIAAIANSATAATRRYGPASLGGTLWEQCRALSRPQLDMLAERIEPRADWNDIVLPFAQLSVLHMLADQARNRMIVYERWGFAGRGRRGLGISALFSGQSGTGKTLAAEVLASELNLDLYRIDLSAIVSKFIGETEKNLKRVFDAAEQGGVVLLFDEADALFGKRSEVKDSHDRYANIEVSYLLQRMESYQGVAILTTNARSALDRAFQRRLRFIVEFPYPGTVERQAIWQRAIPAQTPTGGIEPARLARLNVPGGSIRNIALNAAFIAAGDGTPLGMAHALEAAKLEAAKSERPIADIETRGWV
jgi:SpoVK/Ycf46/Vps4 family AAA+-type ATPase